MKKALTSIARKLRKDPTEAEKLLWSVLRGNKMGVKFRRQVVIGRYVVDFACFEKGLVVEVDGGQHDQSSSDGERDEWLRGQGFVVLRFWNHEVLGNLDGVFQRIDECLIVSPPVPSPRGGG